jgi:hypothetical protein
VDRYFKKGRGLVLDLVSPPSPPSPPSSLWNECFVLALNLPPYVSCNNSKIDLTVIFLVAPLSFVYTTPTHVLKTPVSRVTVASTTTADSFWTPQRTDSLEITSLTSSAISCIYFNLLFTSYISNFLILNRHFGNAPTPLETGDCSFLHKSGRSFR